MKIVIFAGGSGRRLWPISRQRSPKQFEPILGDKSTLQLAVDRVVEPFGLENIFISTNERYADLIRAQLPDVPPANVIGEPARRDLAGAVGLAVAHLSRAAEADVDQEPMAILWGDNYMDQVPTFLEMMHTAGTLLQEQRAKIVFMGETPRFANEHLGWLALGDQLGRVDERPYYGFESLTYRPSPTLCRQMFAGKSHVWNTGYFVTTIGYVRQLYRQFMPDMWAQLQTIEKSIGTTQYAETLQATYPQLQVISFDDAILRHVPAAQAVVLHGEMGWSDPGTLYALKEAINPNPGANVSKGLTVVEATQDSLIYNYEPDKLVAVVGVEGMIVVNTADAVLVVHKDHIPLVKQLVDGFEDTDLEPYS